MNVRLQVFKQDVVNDYSLGRRFRFAVVDLDKPGNYPSNFVCMLPAQISLDRKNSSIFLEVFGDKSLEMARALLTKALEKENDSEVKAEVERRLKLLEPKPAVQVKCRVCGNFFEPERRRFKQKICQECTRKKYASQK